MNRILAILATTFLLAAACGGGTTTDQAQTGDQTTEYGSDLLGDDQDPQQPAGGGDQQPAGGQGGTAGSAGGGAAKPTPRAVTGSGGGGTDTSPMLRSGKAYLRGSVPKMVVEIVAVEGNQPSQQALGRFKQVIGSVVDKPAGMDIKLSKTIPAKKDRYTPEDTQALVNEHQAAQTTRDSAALFILSLNGEDARDPNVLGYAPRGAEYVVIFMEKIRSLSVTSSLPFERAVLIHEVGHLLGLVNLGYKSPRDHEDPANPKHSKNPESVMFNAVEAADLVTALFGEGPPDDFDADDRADLADLKAGRL